MNILKQIPIHYAGELHDIRLVNFSIALDEIADKVPPGITIRTFNGRALISMVDVKLKKMRPVFMPAFCNFNYRHVAFRLLTDDSAYNNGLNKGIYFYRSFTDNALVVAGGGLLTDYHLEKAVIEDHDKRVVIKNGREYVRYQIDTVPEQQPANSILYQTISALDRAYSMLGSRLRVTQIQREKWPIQFVKCGEFETTFFKTARLEGAFRVFETIYYQWLPPRTIQQ